MATDSHAFLGRLKKQSDTRRSAALAAARDESETVDEIFVLSTFIEQARRGNGKVKLTSDKTRSSEQEIRTTLGAIVQERVLRALEEFVEEQIERLEGLAR